MKKNVIIKSMLFFGTALFLVSSCKKNPIHPSVEKTGSLSSFFETNAAAETQFELINSDWDTIITNRGVNIFVYSYVETLSGEPVFETLSGEPVTGSVEVEFIEIYDKKDMILLNKPTMGQSSGGFFPLISAGSFFIKASQNNQELKLREDKYLGIYNVPMEDPNATMLFFHGETSENNQLAWIKAEPELRTDVMEPQYPYYHHTVSGYEYDGYGYYSVSSKFLNQWSIGYPMAETNNQSNIQVQLPAECTPENTSVYISIDGVKSVGGLYDFESGKFVSPVGYTLPVGANVHFVVISTLDGTLKTAIIPATISNNHLQMIPELYNMTLVELTSLLNALP